MNAPTRIPVLDKGWIELLDMMPHPQSGVSLDLAVVNAARTSFLGESKGEEADKKLLFYLMKHHHTTPFERESFTSQLNGGRNTSATNRQVGKTYQNQPATRLPRC